MVVDDLGLETALLAPSKVHAKQHLGPILRLGAAFTGVDADDGVGVVDGAGEHARELRLAKPRLDGRDLRLGVGDGRLIVLRDSELEVPVGVREVLVELLDHLELLLDIGALAKERLRLALVVPEVGRARLFVQLGKSSFELRDVKDAPLAPDGAV